LWLTLSFARPIVDYVVGERLLVNASALEAEINRRVCVLYGLTPEEIHIVETG
jgi:hypothetical protein